MTAGGVRPRMDVQTWTQIRTGALLIAGSFAIHAVMIMVGRYLFDRDLPCAKALRIALDTGRLILVALWLLLAHFLAAALWAWTYVRLGVSETVPDGLYFAFTTYTTLGFGDVLAPPEWQLLTGLAAMNGLLLFALSSAVLLDATQKLRHGPGERIGS